MNRNGFITGTITPVGTNERAAILKGLTPEMRAAVGDNARIYEGVAFANEVARNNGDELSLDGLDLTDYRKNPVILTNHGMSNDGFPIGRAVEVNKVDGKLTTRYILAEGDAYADRVAKLIDSGVLRGLSVGWRTIEATPINPADAGDPFAPHRITKSSLLDISVVGIPADPDGLNKPRGLRNGITLDSETFEALLGRIVAKREEGADPAPAADDPGATPEPAATDNSALEKEVADMRADINAIGGALGLEGFITGDPPADDPAEITVDQARENVRKLTENKPK